MPLHLKRLHPRHLFVKPEPIPRADGISNRAVNLALLGRFTDELFSGLPLVLMPSIRTRVGFSYAQIGVLWLALSYVAAFVEPVSALLIDVWRRHRLLAWGAAGSGLALVVIDAAPSYLLLLVGFALYGAASGPLAHTADVVLVEAHPRAPARIYARSTLLDTVGALLGPLIVTGGIWAGLDWRWMLVGVSLWGPIYAALILRTEFPAPPGDHEAGASLVATFRTNLGSALASRTAMFWLLFVFAEEILDAPLPLRSVWLVDEVGMSQGFVGLYVASELAASLVAIAYLDRWLLRASSRSILTTAVVALFVLYPAWFSVPGIWAKFAIGLPLGFFVGVLWPVAQAELLSSLPGRAGALTALRSTFTFVPLTLVVGVLAECQGLGISMVSVNLVGLAAMVVVLLRLPAGEPNPAPLED